MAETIRIEVVDVASGGSPASSAQGANAPGQGGTQGQQQTVPPGGSWPQHAWNQPNWANDNAASPRRRRGRNRDEMPLEGRGWASYLNREMPYGSFAINQMQWRQESRMGWARDLLGLPDRLERAIVRAQQKSWGKDPEAFENLQRIHQEYRVEKFQNTVEKIGDGIVGMAQMAFRPYRGIANETITFGQTIKSASNTVAGFAFMLGGPLLAGAVKVFSTAIGTGAEVIGLAQAKISEEAGRVRGFSPELRMQGVVSQMREMRTDLEIARQFGGQMARQEDMSSRRESAFRLLTTKLATTVTKPFDRMNEAWTATLESLAGQRDAIDALANAAAAIPGIGGFFKEDADKRNAAHKERTNNKDLENGKKLCEDLLNVILPGEIGLNNKAPLRQRPIKNADFGGAGGVLPGILR